MPTLKEQGKDKVVSRLLDAAADKITAEDIYKAAEKGDKISRRIVDETAVYLDAAIANIINALDPEVIVLAGGMAKAGKIFFDKVKKAAKERALKEASKGVRIVPTELGEDAGIIGAAWRAKC